jgi:hypothetical protein
LGPYASRDASRSGKYFSGEMKTMMKQEEEEEGRKILNRFTVFVGMFLTDRHAHLITPLA